MRSAPISLNSQFRYSVGDRVRCRQGGCPGLIVDRWIVDQVWMPRSGERESQVEQLRLYEVSADGGNLSAEFEEDLIPIASGSEKPCLSRS